MKRIALLIAIIFAVSIVAVVNSIAAEKKPSGKAVNFWHKVTNYPAKVVEKSGETVVDATKNTAGVVATTAKETTDTLTGQTEDPARIVTEPVKEAVTTVGTAAKETVYMPVEAAKESGETASASAQATE